MDMARQANIFSVVICCLIHTHSRRNTQFATEFCVIFQLVFALIRRCFIRWFCLSPSVQCEFDAVWWVFRLPDANPIGSIECIRCSGWWVISMQFLITFGVLPVFLGYRVFSIRKMHFRVENKSLDQNLPFPLNKCQLLFQFSYNNIENSTELQCFQHFHHLSIKSIVLCHR